MIRLEGCVGIDFGCWAGDAVSAAANDAIQELARNVAETFGKMMASLGTFWLYIPTPNLASGAGSNSDVVSFIQNSLIFYVAIAAIISIIITSIRLVLTQKGQHLVRIAQGIVTLIIASAVGVPLLSLLIIAGDEFSVWIVNRATDGADFGANLLFATELAALSGPAGPILVIVLGIIAIVVSLAQVVLILVRMVMLVILAGMLPLAGSFTSTDNGKAWLQKYSGWLLAFLLYKPVAAVIYATAFALISNGVFSFDEQTLNASGQAILNVLAGVMLMICAVVVLVPLMKFMIPAVGAIGASAAGSAIGAGVGAAATGAVSVMGMRGLGGNAGGGTAGAGAGATGAATASAGRGTAAGAGAGASAGAGGGAAAGAAAGSAAGPVGTGAGLAIGAVAPAVTAAGGAAKTAAENAVEGGEPSGSR